MATSDREETADISFRSRRIGRHHLPRLPVPALPGIRCDSTVTPDNASTIVTRGCGTLGTQRSEREIDLEF